MKKILSVLSLIAFVSIGAISTSSFAEDLPAAADATVEAVTDAPVAVVEEAVIAVEPMPAEAAPAEAAPVEAAAPAPVPNKGDTAWMIVATALVSLMVIPGLALFYGG